MTRGRAVAVDAVSAVSPQQRDGRVEWLRSLIGDDWLAGEWDPDRQLIVPAPGGRLTRVARCVVAGCPSDGHWSYQLCVRHRQQFETSRIDDLESWLTSGEPAVFERRHCVDRQCAVIGTDGRGCPRPGQGRWRLCPAHLAAWPIGEPEASPSKRSLPTPNHCPSLVCAWRRAATWG